MPELPEVETTRLGVAPFLTGQRVAAVDVHDPRLRWPVPPKLSASLVGQRIDAVQRRAKYLLLRTLAGTVILHLGMSGSLRVSAGTAPAGPHDHVEFRLADGCCLRYRDPRRFGCILWTDDDPMRHPLLCELGPEPLGPDFSGDYLYQRSRRRRCSVKSLLMDSRVVSGIGNIYASEALFHCGIHPQRAAGRISRQRYAQLADSVRRTLEKAIAAGGTSLRDFTREDGRPGYFRHELQVYDRENLPCFRCESPIRRRVIAQRSSYFCPQCQR